MSQMFPDPPRPPELSLANWREAPQNRWSFRNAREIVPTASVCERAGQAPATGPDGGLGDLEFAVADGSPVLRLADHLRASRVDEFLVLRDERPAHHWADPSSAPTKPHLLFSVSKSLTGLVAGVLEGAGRLDTEAPVTRYVPEMAASPAYGSASVRHLLDMTVSLDFAEDYLDADGAFARYRRAMLWNPAGPGREEGDLLSFLATLGREAHAHGARYHYASPNSDLLGIVVERAGGARYAALLRDHLWRPMGGRGEVSVTLDRKGAARAAGGVSAEARDLARVGTLLLNGGEGVVPRAFTLDLWRGGSREAWLAGGETSAAMPEARYRSQWYAMADPDDCLCAIGIHGQWIYLNPARRVVIVQLASQALPLDDAITLATVASFHAVAASLPESKAGR